MKGGGIFNSVGEIIVQDSTFVDNTAEEQGGGISTDGTATISGSTFVYNDASHGGGLASSGGETTLTNITFSSNSAKVEGGGLFYMGRGSGDTTSRGAMQANHITLAYNSAPAGGGIATNGGMLQIKNSIVANSPSGGDCSGASIYLAALGENIDSDGSCPTFSLTDDPLLGALADNGGLTHTHALLEGSPAIDAAPDCTTVGGAPVSVDQRGMPRPGGEQCDLGAYEVQEGLPSPPDLPVDAPDDSSIPNVTARRNATCRMGPFNNSAEQDYLMQDETALVTGLSQDGYWVEIEGPTWGKACWIWRELLDEEGDVDGVEVKIRQPPADAVPEEPADEQPVDEGPADEEPEDEKPADEPPPSVDDTPPLVPIPQSPGDGSKVACAASISLAWSASSNDNGIAVYYIKLEKQLSQNNWQSTGGFTSTATKLNVPVDCGLLYRWAVRAEDTHGNLSDWSGFSQFGVNLN